LKRQILLSTQKQEVHESQKDKKTQGSKNSTHKSKQPQTKRKTVRPNSKEKQWQQGYTTAQCTTHQREKTALNAPNNHLDPNATHRINKGGSLA
jgi:hypothetical protein